MRRLLYVPIIHSEAELGSLGADLKRRSVALLGEQRWALHQETVGKFWDSLATFLRSFDPRQLKVYQDGLAADGEIGRRIFEEAAKRGGKNYQLILELLNRGAELRKTEDSALLLEERDNLLRLAQEKPAEEKQPSAEPYRLRRDQLMEQRDRFIAASINATLKEGEIGVLFIGAYHNVASRLAEDIAVEFAKRPEQVGAYFEALLAGHDAKGLEKLAQRLTSPISAHQT